MEGTSNKRTAHVEIICRHMYIKCRMLCSHWWRFGRVTPAKDLDGAYCAVACMDAKNVKWPTLVLNRGSRKYLESIQKSRC